MPALVLNQLAGSVAVPSSGSVRYLRHTISFMAYMITDVEEEYIIQLLDLSGFQVLCRWERPRGPVLTLWSSWRRPSSQPCYDKHLQELAARQREKQQVRDDHVMSTSCPGLVSPLLYKDPSCLSNRFAERTWLFHGLLFWNNKKRHSAVSLMVFLRFLSFTWGTSASNL